MVCDILFEVSGRQGTEINVSEISVRMTGIFSWVGYFTCGSSTGWAVGIQTSLKRFIVRV